MQGTGCHATAEAIGQFVSCVFDPHDIVEVRCLPKAKSAWHTAEKLAGQAAALIGLNGNQQNIYVGANPRNAIGGTSAEDVILARCLFVDFDGPTPGEAEERIRKAGLPEPTLILSSGHGTHCYWRLVDPLADLVQWSELQRGLIGLLDSDKSIHDPPRIMRLPGLTNYKRKHGQPLPPVPCVIVEADPTRLYPLADLHAVIERSADITSPNAVQRGESSAQHPTNGKPHFADAVPEVIGEGGRNAALTSLGGYLRRGGMSAAEIASALHAANRTRCRPPLPDQEVETIAASVARYKPDDNATAKANGKLSASKRRPEAPKFAPFPVDALPGPLRRFTTAASKAIGCDPSMVALPMLAAAAGAIGNTRQVRLKHGWNEPAVLWCAPIAKSGSVKSAAMEAPLKALSRRQAAEVEAWKVASAEYEAEYLRYEADRKSRKKSEPIPPPPEKPICRRYWVGDITTEAHAEKLQENPRGLLRVEDELAGMFKGFDQYKSGKGSDVPAWLTMHGARPLMIDRKTGTNKMIFVPRSATSVTGTIQPRTLARVLGREQYENGLAARFFFAMPPAPSKRWSESEIRPEVESELAEVFDGLLSLDFTTNDEGEAVPVIVPLSYAAKVRWVAFFNEHNREQATLDDDLQAAWAKLEGGAARLALVIHCVRVATGEGTDDAIDAESMAAGITLARWFCQEAKRIYAVLGESDEDTERRELIELIRRQEGRITTRQLQHGTRRYTTAEDAELALSELARLGYGRWQPIPPGPEGGKPTREFVLIDRD